MGISGSSDGVVTRGRALISLIWLCHRSHGCVFTYRVSVRKDNSLLDIHVEITVGDFELVDKLAEVGVGDTSVPAGVRVLTENEGGSAVEVRDEALCKALCESERMSEGLLRKMA